MWPLLGLLVVNALFGARDNNEAAPAPAPLPPVPPVPSLPTPPAPASPGAQPPPSPELTAAAQAARQMAEQLRTRALQADVLAAAARARNDAAAAAQSEQLAAQARADAERARAAAAAAIATAPPVVPTAGGQGTVPVVRPAARAATTSTTQAPATASQVRAAAALLVAQASGRGTPAVIRQGQQGMGMGTRDVDGVWGPKTVTRAAYLLGSAGERVLPARSPRAHAARQLAVYVATGGRDPARVRQFQAALGVPQTGALDQPTAAAAQQELAAT